MVSFPTTVLVADDGSPESDRAVDAAAQLVRATNSSLSLVHVRSLSPTVIGFPPTPAYTERLREEGLALVERRTADLSAAGVELEHAEVRLGKRIETTVTGTAAELGVGLLVVGARGGTPGQRYLLGDLSVHLVREARCSVLVVHTEDYRSAHRSPPDGRHQDQDQDQEPEHR
ncbi:nucleotide-binding universal stress UspA family protein [Nocardiopsis sp. Huas11]|uniref:universal stress protein n=1 Tax=Nocardiopsis sp. Huas11 TaxID=2183912 RepID=UPI000EB525B5|nr:universal stress protein [Nocardiopsis sp. Huas11]RKS09338.1 nucleotide-binding universal stress UspA family protein [Nocardiopsis sp. Huas11]